MQNLFGNATEKNSSDAEKRAEFVTYRHKVNSSKMFDTPVIFLMLFKQIIQLAPPMSALRNQIRAVEIKYFDRIFSLAFIRLIQTMCWNNTPIRQVGKKTGAISLMTRDKQAGIIFTTFCMATKNLLALCLKRT